ncbi:MAG: ComF family protein [Alphaproteobacteria bacterium]
MSSPLINFLLPSHCIICNKVLDSDAQICPDCFNKLNFISKPYCKKCGHPFLDGQDGEFCGFCIKNKKDVLNISRSVSVYDEVSKKMIIDFKFFDKTQNIKVFGKWLKIAGADIFANNIDVIIPVPLHFFRLLKRKYNQAGLLAKEIGKIENVLVDYTSLKKKKYTKPQTKFSLKVRQHNVKNSFIIKDCQNIKDKKVLLIDDVMTTGSTLRECARVLLKAGAKEVNVLTLARVL